MTERIEDRDRIEIEDDCSDDVDRVLNPITGSIGTAPCTHGTISIMLDEFGRCARCVILGFWKPNAWRRGSTPARGPRYALLGFGKINKSKIGFDWR
jgi:hypothetical protein